MRVRPRRASASGEGQRLFGSNVYLRTAWHIQQGGHGLQVQLGFGMPQQNMCLGREQLRRVDVEVGVTIVCLHLVGPLLSIGVARHATNPSAALVVLFEGQPRQLGKQFQLPELEGQLGG